MCQAPAPPPPLLASPGPPEGSPGRQASCSSPFTVAPGVLSDEIPLGLRGTALDTPDTQKRPGLLLPPPGPFRLTLCLLFPDSHLLFPQKPTPSSHPTQHLGFRSHALSRAPGEPTGPPALPTSVFQAARAYPAHCVFSTRSTWNVGFTCYFCFYLAQGIALDAAGGTPQALVKYMHSKHPEMLSL